MADVAYNTSSFPALLRTLTSLLALSSAQIHRDDLDGVANDAGDNPGPGSQEREEKPDDRGYGRGCGRHDSVHPLVLLAYKERDPAERQLWDMMTRETGIVLECVGRQAGAGGLPVEIWLGKSVM
jgi:protein N-lysine methyltransferase METTL21D